MARLKLNIAGLIKIFLAVAPFFYGGFYEWVSCLYSLILIGLLFYCLHRKRCLVVRKNLTFLSLAIIVFFYGISGLWAVDRGMAVAGFCKFLPLLLFGMAVMQISLEERCGILEIVPCSGGLMVVLSLIAGLIPELREAIYVNG